MIDGLQHSPPDEFWNRFASMMGDDGLLTYRYLGRRTSAYQDVDRESMRLRHDMRTTSGGIMAAPLAIGTAEAGGRTDQDSVPAPVTYALHVLDDARGVDEVIMRPRVIRIGRSMGFSQSEVVDAADPSRVIAITWGSGVKVADAPSGFVALPPSTDIEDTPDLPPLHEVFEAGRDADGTWSLPVLNPRLTGTTGALHLGPMHVVFEAAAMDLVAAEAGTDRLQAEDWNVMFVTPGMVGPFVVGGDVVRGGLGRMACRLTLHDAGHDHRVVSTCHAVFRLTA